MSDDSRPESLDATRLRRIHVRRCYVASSSSAMSLIKLESQDIRAVSVAVSPGSVVLWVLRWKSHDRRAAQPCRLFWILNLKGAQRGALDDEQEVRDGDADGGGGVGQQRRQAGQQATQQRVRQRVGHQAGQAAQHRDAHRGAGRVEGQAPCRTGDPLQTDAPFYTPQQLCESSSFK